MRRSGLRARVSGLTLLTTLAALVVFASTTYAVIVIEETGEARVEVGVETEDVGAEAARQVLTSMAFALPLALGVAVVASLWLGRRIARPIEDMARNAQAMSAETLGRRLELPPNDDELRALVVAQNALFDRLEKGFSSIRRFAADASHELRTPLTVVRTDLEVLLRRPREAKAWEAAAQRTLEEVQRLERLVESLLQLARADARPRGASTPAMGLLRDVAARFAADASARGGSVSVVDGDEVEIAIPEDVAHIVLSNLVSNAVRHATASVRLGLAREGDEVHLHVDDDGPGVPTADRAEIFEPFRKSAGTEGVGLGLSIAARAVASVGGRIEVSSSPLGGARFSVFVRASR